MSMVLISCDRSPSYLEFMAKDSTFYRQVSEGCDKLLLQASARDGNSYTVRGDDASLPEILRKLKPEFVDIDSNHIYIRIGVGRGAYGITWEQAEQAESKWELTTTAEGLRNVVFSMTKPTQENRPKDPKAGGA